MLMPSKTIKPVDALVCISAYLIEQAGTDAFTIDEIHEKLNRVYPKKLSFESIILCIDYLYILNKLETDKHETFKVKL